MRPLFHELRSTFHPFVDKKRREARAISPRTFFISFLIRFCAQNFQKISNAFAGFSRQKCVAEAATGSIKNSVEMTRKIQILNPFEIIKQLFKSALYNRFKLF